MKISFKPKQAVSLLLSELQDRSRDIIERRYGLTGEDSDGMTLEAIGEIYGITRERVRQIENFALTTIRKSGAYVKAKQVFDELVDAMLEFGGLVREDIFLKSFSTDLTVQNQINFLLTLGESFIRLKEDDSFHHRWALDGDHAECVHRSLDNLYKTISTDDLIEETHLLEDFLGHLKSEIAERVDEVHARGWLDISKLVSSNALGEWGRSDSSNIRTRGMKDYAYLVLRKKGEPMHFSEVASEIEKTFNRKAHVATTHNELIKDDRFVLVGRGLYALSAWGYTDGIVRDVIKKILKDEGAMSKDKIVEEVMKQRKVKENTVYVNLQNSKYFKKDSKGKYTLV